MNVLETLRTLTVLVIVVPAGAVFGQATSASDVSAGGFGANTGGGTYHFPGSVGVGTSAPSSKLDIRGDLTAANFNGGNGIQLEISGGTNPDRELLAGFQTQNDFGFLQTLNRGIAWGAYPLALQPYGGNVGVGTPTPLAKLDVNGPMFGRTTFASYTPDGVWDAAARPSKIFMPNAQELRFGYSDAGGGQYYPSLGFAVSSTAVNNSLLILQARVAQGTPESFNRFQVSGGGTLGWGPGATAVDATLYRSAASALRTNASLVVDGNLGLGTTPGAGYKMHVVGNAHVQGSLTATSLQATYQDVAEWVPATVPMTPGTVVVLDPGAPNRVMPSARAYDVTVAGVVSAEPGLILGVAGESKEQIATTGRVKVRVDASRAPIRIGDLLVSSNVSGAAMRSDPMDINGRMFHQPGTIIGKALEALDSGQGEILVLLSLQ